MKNLWKYVSLELSVFLTTALLSGWLALKDEQGYSECSPDEHVCEECKNSGLGMRTLTPWGALTLAWLFSVSDN